MLPRPHKLSSPTAFSRTIKQGKRAGSKTVVVHLWENTADVAVTGGPRCGLIVSKAVGNAVCRHRTSRRLRHICAALIADGELPVTAQLVIRALPAAGNASTERLDKDVRRGVGKLLRARH